jgi:putative hydrolase of the HAD superfamily
MIEAVLFDLDGTLFDRTASVMAGLHRQYARFAEQLQTTPVTDFVARFTVLDERGYVRKAIVYPQLAAEFGWTPGLAQTLCDDYYARYHDECIGFPGLAQTLADLRSLGVKFGLVTNGSEQMQRGVIRALDLEPAFDAILISESEGIRKPDVRIFERALARLGVGAAQTLFVGDHPINDIAGAQGAGMYTAWKRDLHWGECPQADWVIDDLNELIPIVQRISV